MVAAEQREAEAKGVTGRDGAGHAGPEPWAFGTALFSFTRTWTLQHPSKAAAHSW